LQPSFLEYGLLGIMQPRMDYLSSFCNYDCKICTEVCPSGAIISNDLESKKSIQMGKAIFIKDNCVVYTQKTDCGACAEHCPTKAVKMELDLEVNKKAPKVTDEICVGCGACEFACPTIPYKAIYVDGNAIHQKAQKPKEEKIDEEIDYKEEFPF
jgi:ferredoxin